MTPPPLLTFFLEAARALGSLTHWMVTRRASGRDQVATYFEGVAACLREVAERIEAGDPPRDTCRRLAVYADELEAILADRGYVTASGDASIDETRLRLAGELKKTTTLWGVAQLDEVDSSDIDAEELSSALLFTASRHSSEPSSHRDEPAGGEATVARLEKEVEERARVHGTVNSQAVWDAAGEFRALADALRAR